MLLQWWLVGSLGFDMAWWKLGQRNSLVACLKGEEYNPLLDDSPWVFWKGYWQDVPELWVDQIHDYVVEDEET